MKKKSVVLLSAGLDSTVNLAIADEETKVVLALTFDYGQRAAQKEISSAKKIGRHYKIPHKVINIRWLKDLGESSLTNRMIKIPTGKSVGIDDMKKSITTAKAVWIPNRNGVFLNIAAAFAESYKADLIVPGFNAEEAKTFPDNSLSFVKKTTSALAYSTQNKVKAHCYTINQLKPQIVKQGLKYQAPFHLMWPCYLSLKKWCGQCESCQRARRAFAVNGLTIDAFTVDALTAESMQ